MIFRRLTLAALAMIAIPTMVQAASNVSTSSGVANIATATVTASVASTQTATIISSAATGGFTSGTGGFTSGGGVGGFSSGGSGGFSGGTGGNGGFTGGSGSGGFGGSSGPELKPQSYTPPSGSGRVTSQSIGDAGVSNGLWGQALYAHINKTETGLEMRGNVYNGLVGFDHRFMNDYLVGVSTGYEYVDIDTRFNHGSYKSDGISLVPYAAITLTPNWTWDMGAGYTWLNYHSTSQYDTVKSDYSGGRWIGTTTLTGSYAWDNWRAQFKTSLLYSREHQESYYDTSHSWNDATTLSLGRLSGGGKFGYAVGEFLPYVKVMAEWDFLRPGAVVKGNNQLSHVDDGGGVAGLGMEYTSGGVTSSLEVDNNSVMRKDMDVWAVIARLRWEW